PGRGFTRGLTAGEEAVASTEPTRRLAELAAEIRADRELLSVLLDGSEAQALVGLRPRLDGYLREFGDRCIGELKLETVSLRQDPTFLIRILRNFVVQDDLDMGALGQRAQERRVQLQRDAAARLGPWKRLRLRRAVGTGPRAA